MSSSKIRVLIVDDHELVRQGIVTLLGDFPDIDVVGEARDGASAVAAFRRTFPDVTLMDVRMPQGAIGGIETIAILRREFPGARFIVLSNYDSEEDVERAVRAGARGYLLKDVRRNDLVNAIRAVHGGDTALPSRVHPAPWGSLFGNELTAREHDVLRMLVRGMSNQAIAAELDISPSTVKKHVNHLLAKLNVQSRAQAIVVALERGLVALGD